MSACVCVGISMSGFMCMCACVSERQACVFVSVFLVVCASVCFIYGGKRSEERLLAQSPSTGDIRSSEPAKATHAC